MPLPIPERVPLEMPESQHLEFKSREALTDLKLIGRAVVAMLNGLVQPDPARGDIWIGVRQAAGRIEVQAIDDAEAQRQRLRDYLEDVIEPRPEAGELVVETVPAPDQGGPVILIRVAAPADGRRPFALMSKGARLYVRRLGDRIVPMARDELLAAARAQPALVPQPAAAAEHLREGLRRASTRTGQLWLGLEFEPVGDIDFSQDKLAELLTDPTRSGSPRSSFNVCQGAFYQGPRGQALPDWRRYSLATGRDDSPALRLFGTGGLEFTTPLHDLSAGRVPYVAVPKLLSPERLVGYLVSALRLAGALADAPEVWHKRPEGELWAALAVFGVEGWVLLPGDLSGWPMRRHEVHRFALHDLILGRELAFTHDELLHDPDRCAMRLIRELYLHFGMHGLRDLPTIAGSGLLPAS